MLFMNDPEAFKTVIQERRRDNGQRLATIADVTRPAPTTRPSKPQSPRRHLSPRVATN